MNSTTIEKWQAAKIHAALFPGVNYLLRLRERMEKVGFPHDDDFYQHVCAAYEAANRLRNKVHYLSCDGVGPPSVIGHKMPGEI